MNGFEQERISGFRPQEKVLSLRIEKLLSEGNIPFDKQGYWEHPTLHVGIAKRQEDGIFFAPEFFLGEPISLTHGNEDYPIYQM
jgi:hypothetical protein